VKSQAKKRYETIVQPATKEKLAEEIDRLVPQATRQKEILTFFIEHHEPIVQSVLYNELSITRTHLNPLINKQLLTIQKREVYRDPYTQEIKRTEKLTLTEEQQRALDDITMTIDNQAHRTFLLHGITGSGKTEVYLQAIEKVIKRGQEAIVLVPEISLTPQMVHRFKGRFGDRVAVLH